jgi:CRISPR-associated endonuclease/helicase Cas3
MSIAHRRDRDGVEQKIMDHLIGVSDRAKLFADKIGLRTNGELIGLIHDIGKYSREFQKYIKSAVGLIDPDGDGYVDVDQKRGRVDHSSAGAQLVWTELSKEGLLGLIAGQVLSLCIASHHSGLIDCIGAADETFGKDLFTKRMEKSEEQVHRKEVLSLADAEIIERFNLLQKRPELISGIKQAFARIIMKLPEKDDKSPIVQFHFGLLVRFLFSALLDADRLDTADFEKPRAATFRQHGSYAKWDTLIERLERYLADIKIRHSIDHLRRNISLNCLLASSLDRGIYTLTVPTGGGKTLSSLRFALHHAKKQELERIIYVIPFTSIIDQNADVVRSILEPDSASESAGKIVLEHHSNLTQEREGWKEKILSENWDAPVVFTTMVQLLEALFGSGTRGARRMHQLANAVLIFDEIQTLPVRCIHMFNNAMNFLVEQCGSTVLLCTATQPLLDRVDPKKGVLRLSSCKPEIIPDVKELFDELNRVEVKDERKPKGWPYEEIAELAINETRRVGSCLVIVNTKREAQTLFNQCRDLNTGILICHLSTSMCPAHRRFVLSEVREYLNNNKPILCVSTQLIEAGVDVDFGAVIRFNAGLDSIAQAAGRCNRNGRNKCGLVHIINPQDENLDKLPDILVGKNKADRVLDDYAQDPRQFRNSILGPEAMDWYYKNYFFARQNEMVYPVCRKRIGHDDDLFNLLSSNSLAVAEYGKRNKHYPELYLRQAFMTASKMFQVIDAPTQGVVVPYGEAGRELIAKLCAEYDLDKAYSLLKRAQQFSVNVFPNIFKKLTDNGAVYPVQKGSNILYLDGRYYSKTFGLSDDPVEEGRDYFA